MALTSYDAYLSRFAQGYSRRVHFNVESLAMTAGFGRNEGYGKVWEYTIPTLETGVTSYRPVSLTIMGSVASTRYILFKYIDMGSLNIGTNAFTDGSAAPTITECNVSRAAPLGLMAEITTAFNATPGTQSVTYVDQDNNTAEASTSTNFGNSAAVGSMQWIIMNSGDYAVLDVTTASRTGGTTPSGVMRFIGVTPICSLTNPTAYTPASVNMLTLNSPPMKLVAGDKLMLVANDVSAKSTMGSILFIGED